MPVRYDQIDELYSLLLKHMSRSTVRALLRDFRNTQAYQTNSSFRETVDRLNVRMPPRKS